MLKINNLSMSFGHRVLFQGINCTLAPGQRVGLVGINGAGKSTLLRILSGQLEAEGQQLEISRGLKRAYLPQEIVAGNSGKTVFQEAASAFAHLADLQKRLTEVNEKISSKAHPSENREWKRLLELQNKLQEELHSSEFFQMDAEVKKVLFGLGFSANDLERNASDLSGGWIMRLELAKILLRKPDFIFLDEPTNHLDLPSLSWLEQFLVTMDAGYVIVSHDRTFLDNTVRTIWELEAGRLTVYKGNFGFYQKERRLRREHMRAERRKRQLKMDQLETFVQRFGAKASKARQAKNKLRQMARLRSGGEDPVEERNLRFALPKAPLSGRTVLQVEDLSKAYNGSKIFSEVSFMLQRGEKMAVVGPNGAGKSTLLKIIAGRERQEDGTLSLGHNVITAYFGQHQAQELDPDLDLVETMYQLHTSLPERQIRNILGTFLFGEDDVRKRVSSLSGGEKSRLALARIMASRANLLLLDEPTNHLDMDSRKAVELALRGYNGTVMVVSHDRTFLDAFVDRVLEMRGGTAVLYPGNLTDFLAVQENSRPQEQAVLEGEKGSAGHEGGPRTIMSRRDRRRHISRIRQEKSSRLQPLRRRLTGIEDKIARLEDQRKSLEEQLADPSTYRKGDEIQGISAEYRAAGEELQALYAQWEETGQEMERISAEYDSLMETI